MNIKTYVINLEKRKDRLEELKIPFNYEVFVGTDGHKLYENDDYTKNEKGQLGCLDSHKRLLQKIYDNNDDHSLIFEDDVELCEDFINKLNIVMEELPEDWDMIYLGGWNVGEKKPYSNNLDIAEKVFTTHSYMIRKKIIPILLEEINKLESYKVDVIYSYIQKNNKCFIASPVLCWQRPGFSDIENKITNNTHLL